MRRTLASVFGVAAAGIAGPSALAATSGISEDPPLEGLTSFVDYPGKIALLEPHLDDKELWCGALLSAPDLYHVYGVIPQSPASVLASLESLRSGGPFRPSGSAPIIQTPLQAAFKAEGMPISGPPFDQDWFSYNVIPLRVDDPDERLAALAARDGKYADPYVLRERVRLAMYTLADRGVTKFVTLNPAGTYGHPHHMALSEAVADIAVEISDRFSIPVEVWNDATLREHPEQPDPTGVRLYSHALDIPGVPYTGWLRTPVDAVIEALQSYKNRYIDPGTDERPDWKTDCDTWHEDGTDFPLQVKLWRRVGFNPGTGKVEDALRVNDAVRAYWDNIIATRVPPTYVVPVSEGEAHTATVKALQEKARSDSLRTENRSYMIRADILAPTL